VFSKKLDDTLVPTNVEKGFEVKKIKDLNVVPLSPGVNPLEGSPM
jgi:hypothetical protein